MLYISNPKNLAACSLWIIQTKIVENCRSDVCSFLLDKGIAEMLQSNTTLQSLNIESNFITAQGMMAIIKALGENSTLTEIKIDNQVRHYIGVTDHNAKCIVHVQL